MGHVLIPHRRLAGGTAPLRDEPISLVRWLDDYLQTHAVRRDEYCEVLSQLYVLEERIVQPVQCIDQRFEQIDQCVKPKETQSPPAETKSAWVD